MNSKLFRYLSGFIILFLILASIVVSRTALMIMSAVFIVFTLREYRQMFRTKDIEVIKLIPEFIGVILSYLFIYDYQNWVTPAIVIGIFLTCSYTIVNNKKPYMPIIFTTIMSFIFIFCTLYIVKLFYFVSSESNTDAAVNLRLVFTYIAAVMAGDFTASKIGPHFKNRLLAPEISPNKTIAGAAANLISSCIVTCSLYPLYPIYKLLLLGVVISISSQIGDLTISMIKRDLGIKHSGNLFLNYGGILDRVDAFIFSAPFAYYCLLFITYLLK